jgi:DNA-directed RNA polymerase specialized sigma24 family protein
MREHDYTDMGGTGQAFLTTHWSVIKAAGPGDEDKDRALIGLLLNQYWRPVYCYLRRKGFPNEQAKDLTQGFFHEVVLQRHLVQKADPAKGRFRSFLLIALNRYLNDVRDAQAARKRIPREKLVSLDIIEPAELPLAAPESAPEDCFNTAWISLLLERALEQVEAQCHRDGKTVHWNVFRDRVLQPIMNRAEPPSMNEICIRYGIDSEAAVSNVIVTVKRRLQRAMREELRRSVTSEEFVDGEMEELRRFFPGIAQEL